MDSLQTTKDKAGNISTINPTSTTYYLVDRVVVGEYVAYDVSLHNLIVFVVTLFPSLLYVCTFTVQSPSVAKFNVCFTLSCPFIYGLAVIQTKVKEKESTKEKREAYSIQEVLI